MSRRLLRSLGLGALIGLGLGLYYGWIVHPPLLISGGLTALRQDYKDDYVVMVAEAFGANGDLGQAKDQLAALGLSNPGPAVAAVAERFISDGRDKTDIRRLAVLANALGHTTPAIAPYLEGAHRLNSFPSLIV